MKLQRLQKKINLKNNGHPNIQILVDIGRVIHRLGPRYSNNLQFKVIL